MNARIARPFLAVLASAALFGSAAAQAPAPAAAPPPPAPAKKAEPSPEAVKEGKALFAKFVDSLGGPS